MDNKSELFDLKREKRELDTFLSRIAEVEASEIPSSKDTVQTTEAISSLVEQKSTFEVSHEEPSDLKLEMPAVKSEDTSSIPFTDKDKHYAPSVNEFIPRLATDTVSLDIADQSNLASGKAPSLMSMDDGKKADIPSRITVSQSVKPLESFKTMTRFDGTTKFDGQVVLEKPLAETPLLEEKKVSAQIESGKKIDKTNPYDFAPEKKDAGKGKWIWILIILLILLLIGYFWHSSKSSVSGLGSFFKTNQSASTSSVKEIKLLNVRQRLVYNVKLGKSIRVVEGIAENATTYPVSKVKIAANLYNADGALLASMESFSGNILIDAKLESLDAVGLIADLKNVNTAENMIPPKGQKPFMIIFTSELAGVHKLSVLAVDFEKH